MEVDVEAQVGSITRSQSVSICTIKRISVIARKTIRTSIRMCVVVLVNSFVVELWEVADIALYSTTWWQSFALVFVGAQ